MKKVFALGVLSVVALAGSARPAAAWWPCFPLFNCSKCCSCCTTICMRQYNAFTPFCSGSLYCDGCCPPPFNAYGQLCGMGMGGMGGMGYGMGMGGPNCEGGACYGGVEYLPSVGGATKPVPTAPGTVTPGTPGYQAPAPTPVESGPMTNYRAPGTFPMVQPASYRPMFYPAGMPRPPQAPMPVRTAAPYYWYRGAGY